MAPNNKAADLFNVNGMVIVITGGGSGLGAYAARAFDANGAKAVYIVGRREGPLKETAQSGPNGSIIPVVGDISDRASISKVADQVRQEHGYINLLFANSGIMGPSHSSARDVTSVKDFQEFFLQQSKAEDFTQTYNINSTGTFYTAMTFLDLLDAGNKKRNVPQDSQILVTSSIAGFSRYLASSFAYSSSKAAVNHLVKMLATAFASQEFHIRVNAIAPGLYPSEMTAGSMSRLDKFQGVDGHPEAFADAQAMPHSRSPAERTGSEEDFAATVVYFASRAGAYLNGEILVTVRLVLHVARYTFTDSRQDGGRLAQLPATY